MTTDARLDEIEARANAATEGPWHCTRDDTDEGDIYYDLIGAVGVVNKFIGTVFSKKEDGEFLEHARSDIPYLISEVRRRRTALEACVKAMDAAREVVPLHFIETLDLLNRATVAACSAIEGKP